MAFGAGESAWRRSTPNETMMDVLRTVGGFDQSFSRAFSQASDQAADQKRMEAANPPLPAGREGSWYGADAEMMNGPGGRQAAVPPSAEGVSLPGMMSQTGTQTTNNVGQQTWDGSPAPSWMNFKMRTPTDAIGAVLSAKNVDEAANIRAANADWESNPTYRKIMDSAFKAPADRQKAMDTAERIKIAKQTADNNTVASRIIVDDAKQWNARVAKLDPESRSSLIGMERNPDGTISPTQWRALGTAEQVLAQRQENERTRAEVEALARGDQQRTVITDKGVAQTFTPAKPEEVGATPVVPQETTLSDGSRIAFNPKTGSFRFLAKQGQEKELTIPQLQAIGTHLRKQDTNDPNAKLIFDFLGATAKKQVAPNAAAPVSPVPATATVNANDPLGLFR